MVIAGIHRDIKETKKGGSQEKEENIEKKCAWAGNKEIELPKLTFLTYLTQPNLTLGSLMLRAIEASYIYIYIGVYGQQVFFYADFIKLKMQLRTAQLLLCCL